VNTGGGSDTDEAYSAALDVASNVFITGSFSSTAIIDGATFTSGTGSNMFLANFNSSGGNGWSLQSTGVANAGHVLCIDDSANVYVAGEFGGTITIGTANLISSGNSDLFISKFSSNGIFQWAVKAGGTSDDAASSIRTDANGNVYITGFFDTAANFGGINIISAGGHDVFVVKYNSSGTAIWARSAGGAVEDESSGLVVADSNNIFITGHFAGTSTFGSTVLTSIGAGNDVFIAKLNSSGIFQWASRAGGIATDKAYDATADAAGNCYITGVFADTISFDSHTLISNGTDDLFIVKYNTSGSAQWAQHAGGASGDRSYSICSDDFGNVYITGSFGDTASFNTTILFSNGDKDVFVAAYNSSGNLLWATSAGGAGFDRGYGIDCNNSGDVIVTGVFEQSATFGSQSVNTAGARDLFITKLYSPVGIFESEKEENYIQVFPNPSGSSIFVSLPEFFSQSCIVNITDAKGATVKLPFHKMKNEITIRPGESVRWRIDISGLSNGIYFLEIISDDACPTWRGVKRSRFVKM
jgi:hypothetical protein